MIDRVSTSSASAANRSRCPQAFVLGDRSFVRSNPLPGVVSNSISSYLLCMYAGRNDLTSRGLLRVHTSSWIFRCCLSRTSQHGL